MRSLGIPATLFVPTAFPDQPQREFWWDRLSRAIHSSSFDQLPDGPWGKLRLGSPRSRQKSFRQLKGFLKQQPHALAMEWVERLCAAAPRLDSATPSVLSWSQLRQLAGDGVAMGVHTRSHPLLTHLESDLLGHEVGGAWQELKSRIENALPVFAYPAGAVSQAAYTELKQAGLRLAFTTRPGSNDLQSEDPLLLRRLHVGLRTSRNVLRAKLALSAASPRFRLRSFSRRARRTTRVHPEACSVSPRVAGVQISTSVKRA
jgi:peptidoglycan/xylan/chitin deacetylase (PgdA/CDA1 family)